MSAEWWNRFILTATCFRCEHRIARLVAFDDCHILKMSRLSPEVRWFYRAERIKAWMESTGKYEVCPERDKPLTRLPGEESLG